MGWRHRVTFNMNTNLMEVTRAYTSYMKIKKVNSAITKEGQDPGTLSNTTRSGMNILGDS